MIPDTVVGLPWSGSVAGVGLSMRLLGTVPVPTPVVLTGLGLCDRPYNEYISDLKPIICVISILYFVLI